LRTNTPALSAARARTNAALQAVAGVRTWDDPMVRAGYMFADDQEMMRMGDGDALFGVEQKLPLFGKPQAMRRMVRAEFEVAVSDADLRFQVLRSDLAKALFRAAFVHERVGILEDDIVWLKQMLASAEARFKVGTASLPEVLRLQNERSRRQDELVTARQFARQEEVTLNRLLNRPVESRWPQLQLPKPADPISYSEQLVQFAFKYEPRLRKMRDEVRVADAAVNKAQRERYPEVRLGVNSRGDSSNGDWRQTEVMVGLSLPIFNRSRYRADIAREEARRLAAVADVAEMELASREEVHGLTVKIDAARREALVFHDEVIPRSEQALKAAQAAWQAESGSFYDLMESRRMLLDAELMHARAISEQWQMLSELVLCCGLADLEALQMLNLQTQGTNGQPPLLNLRGRDVSPESGASHARVVATNFTSNQSHETH
jgi:cobalt-zinc-cadmium efflux system outer membrane protein